MFNLITLNSPFMGCFSDITSTFVLEIQKQSMKDTSLYHGRNKRMTFENVYTILLEYKECCLFSKRI